jgi:hypothetical protein
MLTPCNETMAIAALMWVSSLQKSNTVGGVSEDVHQFYFWQLLIHLLYKCKSSLALQANVHYISILLEEGN